jgi:CubicO group peptidase (beta-lactamase class C family)
MARELTNAAPAPARGSYADGFHPVAARFADQLASGRQIGGAFSVYHRGEPVVDLWGGSADTAAGKPWKRDTRIVVFSVTKGFAAMAFNMLVDRGELDWDAPVAEYWPTFARAGKGDISVRTLLNHRAGLPYLDQQLTLDDFTTQARAPLILNALEAQHPIWEPGQQQGYHATTFGMYASELFARVAGESMGTFLRRELFAPLGSDVWLGTPPSEDGRVATLYPPSTAERAKKMIINAVKRPESVEAKMFKAVLAPKSIPRRAFSNPSMGSDGIVAYNHVPVRRAELAWASATASADGVARAYLPFASGGTFEGERFLDAATLEPVYERQGWSNHDVVLQKPVGWSGGFLKEETQLFSPNPESFGHAGLGGTLGWADPKAELTIGYVMNRMDWRVRSLRALELCRALYECEPVQS